ncbi:MAG: hypothetical protein IV092_16215 [Burkholderiaceae bacterium]|nr:hypothetical protein [Burkholderiaceae bacterium]
MDRDLVPVFVLRVPVRYYRQPPPYFRGWRADAPPRWGDHWGLDWAQQRPYSGERYPRAAEQQDNIRSRHERAPQPTVTRPVDTPRSQPGEPTRRGNAPPERQVRPSQG